MRLYREPDKIMYGVHKMGNSYNLSNIPEALKKNQTNYVEFYGRDSYMKKRYCDVYGDLMKTIAYFNEIGLAWGSRIGIIGSNSYEYMMIDLAAAVGGFISVPFTEKDFNNSIEQLGGVFCLSALFVDEAYYDSNPGDRTYKIKDLLPMIEKADYSQLQLPVLDNEACFAVIFTSGTTGIPKGIEIRVKCVEEWISSIVEGFDIRQDDKILNFLSLSISNARLFVYSSILISYNLTLTNPDQLARVLILSKPTILQGVPYLFETFYWGILNDIKQSLKSRFLFGTYLFMRRLLPSSLSIRLGEAFSGRIKSIFGGNIRLLVTGSAPISESVLEFYENMNLRIYEAYGINEIGLVSINNLKAYRLGSVGKPFPTKSVLISEDDEILIRSEYAWGKGYLNDQQGLGRQVFREDGYIATGDIGHFDEDGFLYVDGRKKEVLVLSNGQKIHPGIIEEELKKSGIVKQAVAIGNQRSHVVCVIVPIDKEFSKSKLNEAIRAANKNLADSFMIKDCLIASGPFTLENGLMNSTLKINRNAVYTYYEKEIDLLYN